MDVPCPHCGQLCGFPDPPPSIGICPFCAGRFAMGSPQQRPQSLVACPCPHCGYRMAVGEDLFGELMGCPQCGGRILIADNGRSAAVANHSFSPRSLDQAETKRPPNGCVTCGYEWSPRGKDKSPKCPQCGSTGVVIIPWETWRPTPERFQPSPGCGCTTCLYLAGGVVILLATLIAVGQLAQPRGGQVPAKKLQR